MWSFGKKIKAQVPKGPALSCIHTGHCSKNLCPLWQEFTSTVMVEGKPQPVKEGLCTLAWTPRLIIELRNTINAKKFNTSHPDANKDHSKEGSGG